MTHGFDDQGAQYDKDGNMQNWWTKEDETKFKEKGKAVVKLYNGLTVLDTVHVKGELTLGENIADIGGIAELKWVAEHAPKKGDTRDLEAARQEIAGNVQLPLPIRPARTCTCTGDLGNTA